MDQARIEKVLKLILLLAKNRFMTIGEIAEKWDTSERTIYRYIDTIREVGFVVKRDRNGVFFIDKTSASIKKLSDLVYFSDEEAYLFNEVLDSIEETTQLKKNLKKKLSSVYDFSLVAKVVTNTKSQNNVKALTQAIESRKAVILHDYYSSHGDTQRDRLVEPFAFTTNFVQVWCYEPESRRVKMFKLSRIQQVEVLDLDWKFQSEHKKGFVDVFRIHSDHLESIQLKLSVRAANLLVEEYPMSKEYLKKIANNRWLLTTDVCSFEGVGRFILGLYDDIEIIENDKLKTFIASKIKRMKTLAK